MMTFRDQRLRNFAVPMSTAWLLSDLAEAKGKQALFTRQSPQVLKALQEMALVQSVESSNRIEGVTVAADRLVPLVLGNARPRDRSEHEIAGYRRALDLIHTGADALPITPDLLRRLHRLCQEGNGDAGEFKRVDNEIIALRPGPRRSSASAVSRPRPRPPPWRSSASSIAMQSTKTTSRRSSPSPRSSSISSTSTLSTTATVASPVCSPCSRSTSTATRSAATSAWSGW